MDRLFSMFPSGRAGVGLLCLRLAVVLTLTAGVPPAIVVRLALAFASALVLVGFLTPVVAGSVAAVALTTAGWSLLTGHPPLFDTLLVHGLVATDATALVMIGPGAYSVDARLFGWRELRMPDPGQD